MHDFLSETRLFVPVHCVLQVHEAISRRFEPLARGRTVRQPAVFCSCIFLRYQLLSISSELARTDPVGQRDMVTVFAYLRDLRVFVARQEARREQNRRRMIDLHYLLVTHVEGRHI